MNRVRAGLGCSVAPVAVALLLWSPSRLVAQTFQGRVVDERQDRPVSTALVRLVDAGGEQYAVTIADSSGVWRLDAPRPGTWRLQAARLGYENFESPLLSAADPDGVYPVDLVMAPAPVELPGFTVESERVSDGELSRQLRLMLGISPASMRYRPIDWTEIQDHVAKAHSLVDVMRWTNNAGLVVTRDPERGPCFSLRGAGCLPVYLNGMPLRRDFVEAAPLDMLETIVVVTPTDVSMAYPNGAVLLYTGAWLR